MIKYNANTKYSEVISTEDIKKWKGNVILEGGTATGKTYFILNVLAAYCKDTNKKILFLCNRNSLQDELRKEIIKLGLTDIITVLTYQKIEHSVKNNEELLLNHDYLVCDEFHHVNEIYNVYTDLSYDWIINHPGTKIFISATCHYIFNMLVNKNIVPSEQRYYIPKDYSYVDNLYFYSKNKDITEIINDKLFNTNDKIIYFSSNLERAIEIYKCFKEQSSFYSSKHSKKGAKYITENCIQNETFNSRLLVTTKALDVGITLKDKSIKHVITDMFDIDTLIQCIGRKRIIDENDSCNFYIKNHSSNSMKGNKSRLIRIKQPIKVLIKDKELFFDTYVKDRKFHNNYIYKDEEGNYTYNHIAYKRLVTQLLDIDDMEGWSNNYNKTKKGFKGFLLERLGDTMTNIIDMDEMKQVEELNNLDSYINSIIGKPLLKDQREELFQKISLKDSRGRLQKTLGTINGYLINNFNVNIQTKTINVEGKRKTAWILSDL